uniref:WGS project CBME000000000 data, contig CS3487_c002502 n=1 Tax=Fusarium pseudograminearum CS3487 TaxID=1318458 RepID=A0A096PF82_FUSPS|nr:unnamed protein product [Fusarium pseudograminearum CS3487]
MPVPSSTRAWSVTGVHQDSFAGLELAENVPVPQLCEHDVLVEVQAVSLNYRDLAIPKGLYPFAMKTPVIAGSDGAGKVLAVGSKVIDFAVGDSVCTLFNELHQNNPITPEAVGSGLGGAVDGTLRKYAVFPDHGLVQAPSSLNAIEASTLTCAPLTAWNALYGVQSKAIKAGDWVLTQGTGGVSLAAIQFAAAAGATVVSTTSSNDKAEALKNLGASHVLNYREDPNWGESARALTPKGLGFDHILEIGGAATVAQSLKAIKLEGLITIIGFLTSADSDKQPPLMDALNHICMVRGVFVGSKQQFVEMNRAIDSAKIHPVVDSKIFSFDDAQAAYEYQWAQGIRHVSPQTKIWIQLGDMSSALEAAKICQPDALVLQGSDAGGHGHAHGASLITLIPEVVDALENEGIANIPLIAAGGIMDGRSAAAAVMLGASGVVMGTRYLGAKEANFDANVREAVFSTTDAGKATGAIYKNFKSGMSIEGVQAKFRQSNIFRTCKLFTNASHGTTKDAGFRTFVPARRRLARVVRAAGPPRAQCGRQWHQPCCRRSSRMACFNCRSARHRCDRLDPCKPDTVEKLLLRISESPVGDQVVQAILNSAAAASSTSPATVPTTHQSVPHESSRISESTTTEQLTLPDGPCQTRCTHATEPKAQPSTVSPLDILAVAVDAVSAPTDSDSEHPTLTSPSHS